MASQKVCKGSVAERSKALVLGTSLLGGVGSNPTTANLLPEYNSLLSLPQHPPQKKVLNSIVLVLVLRTVRFASRRIVGHLIDGMCFSVQQT